MKYPIFYDYMISKYIFESEIIHPKIQLLAFFNIKYFENDEMASIESIITKLSLLLFLSDNTSILYYYSLVWILNHTPVCACAVLLLTYTLILSLC